LDRTRVVAALERLYGHHETDLHAWASGVTAEAYPLLEEGATVGCMIFDLERCHFMDVKGLPESVRAEYRDFGVAAFPEVVTPEAFAAAMRGPHMVSLWSALDIDHSISDEFMRRAGSVDMLGITGEPEPGLGIVLVAGLPKKRALRSDERSDLTRIALHLEASARARLHPESVIGTVSLQGKLELGAHVPTAAARAGVRDQVTVIESLRTKKHRRDGERALTLWKALTSGSLSLLERIDTDGKRFYDLYENPPWRTALRALSAEEAEVVSQATRGLTNKEIGYALGRSQATVSRLLGTAAQKVGLPGARALLRVARRLLDSDAAKVSTELTSAEQGVLRLLAEGHSNRQIAERRGVALRTVANQVSSVLAKTGAPSRRGLLGRPVEEPLEPTRRGDLPRPSGS
jgi:DNA-binding NarL/FixJ family response regulator